MKIVSHEQRGIILANASGFLAGILFSASIVLLSGGAYAIAFLTGLPVICTALVMGRYMQTGTMQSTRNSQ